MNMIIKSSSKSFFNTANLLKSHKVGWNFSILQLSLLWKLEDLTFWLELQRLVFIVAPVIKSLRYPFYESKQCFRKSSKILCYVSLWLFMELLVFVCVKISWLCIWILGAFVQQCAMVWKDFLSCSCVSKYISGTVVSKPKDWISKIRIP